MSRRHSHRVVNDNYHIHVHHPSHHIYLLINHVHTHTHYGAHYYLDVFDHIHDHLHHYVIHDNDFYPTWDNIYGGHFYHKEHDNLYSVGSHDHFEAAADDHHFYDDLAEHYNEGPATW